MRVTAETCPHYWMLNDEAVSNYDSNAKMNPPLRAPEDQEAVIAGLVDGTLDCISTDHAPHTPTEKEVEFALAPFGIIGLETSLALSITGLVTPGHLSLERIIALLSWEGAKVCKLDAGRVYEGGPADLCVFDADAEWEVHAAEFKSKSRNCPFIGRTLRGLVKHTLCDGKTVYSA